MSKWLEPSEQLPPRGVLVFACDFDATELASSYYSAWYTDLGWRSHQVATYKTKWVPRYWMPIPPLPQQQPSSSENQK